MKILHVLINVNNSELESDKKPASDYITKHRATGLSIANIIGSTTTSLPVSSSTTNGNGNEASKKKSKKVGNRMELKSKKSTKDKSEDKSKTTLMFINYIPLASDLISWILRTDVKEFCSDNELSFPGLYFPLNGMNISDYDERMLKASENSSKTVISKTDEVLPEIFKEFYRKIRKEYLSKQKNNQETNSNSSGADTESSNKENGDRIEEITIYDSDDEPEIIEPSQSKKSLNGRQVKSLSRLPSTPLTRMSSATKVSRKKTHKSSANIRQV